MYYMYLSIYLHIYVFIHLYVNMYFYRCMNTSLIITEGTEQTAASRLFSGVEYDDDSKPIKAKRLTPTAVPEERDPSGGWWTSTKK